MSEGVFAVHRGVFKHPMFEGDEYSRRDAWLWLIGNAVWEAKRVRVNKQMIDLQRGELAFSERFFASAWKWSKSRVHRFLSQLSHDAMIVLKSDQGVNHITICNYDSYAFDGTKKRTARGPAADQQRTKEKENQENQENQNNLLGRTFEELRSVYPKRTPASPPKPAKQKLETKLKEGHDPQRILAGARAYAAEQEAAGNVGTKYIKTLEVWINQEGWNAYDTAPTGPPLPDDPIARRDLIRKEFEAENARRTAEAASRSVLARGFGVGEESQQGSEESRVVRLGQQDAKGIGGMVRLFPKAAGVSADRHEDAGTRDGAELSDADAVARMVRR